MAAKDIHLRILLIRFMTFGTLTEDVKTAVQKIIRLQDVRERFGSLVYDLQSDWATEKLNERKKPP
jgi:hypothetical protein